MSKNTLIHASAGSGKTFQLSNRYLDIAFGGAAWETVLASTFTKKAAGEILNRILIRLAEAALDDSKRISFSKELNRPTPLSRQEVLDLLLHAVHNLHRLRVGTLDSFFIQIASSFCLELGIPLGWKIVEEIDNQRYLAEAVREVFRQNDKSEVIRLMHLLSKGEVTRSITQEAFTLAKNLIQLYRDTPADAWYKLGRQSTLSPDELEIAIQKYLAAELPSHKTIIKQRFTDIERIRDGDWNKFLGSGPAKCIAVDRKYSYCSKPIEGEYKEAMDQIIKHAKAVIINKLAIQTEATGELLEQVSEQFERIKKENRALRFDDITFKLSGSKLHDRLDQIVHRIDSPTHHLLLDEFQDTSPLQWEVLRPFVFAAIETIKQRDGSFFCVGDTKQAIYGWRGGVAEIFDTVKREITPLHEEPCHSSYRSSQPVIDTINELFGKLQYNTALAQDVDYDFAARNWKFKPHKTEKKELSGYCTLDIAPLYDPNQPIEEDPLWEDFEETDETSEESNGGDFGKDDNQVQTTLRYAISRIAELHRETPQATIGVLVRTNRMVGRLIRGLKRIDIPASEEGGNPLTDSPAVEIILSALTLADHPGNTVCRFHLATGPLGPAIGLVDVKNDFQAATVSRKIRTDLLKKGYGAVIADWIAVLVSSCDQRNLDRLLQLLQLAYSWENDAPIRADRFVEMVRDKHVETPSAAKIRVMTIHQSKGLQFDVVVLPELTTKLIGQPPMVVVGRKGSKADEPDPMAPIDRIIRYASETVQSFLPDPFPQMFANYRQERVKESLCLLYVAMTRAIHRLCMIIPPIKPKKTAAKKDEDTKLPKTYDGVLRCGLVTPGCFDTPFSTLYEHGDSSWWCQFNARHAKQEESAKKPLGSSEPVKIVLKNNSHPQRNLLKTSPSQLEGTGKPQQVKAKSIDTTADPATTRKNRRIGRLWGTAMHACFEKALTENPWLDETMPDRNSLLKTVRESMQSLSTEIEPEQVVDSFFKICEKPEIREALSHPQLNDFRYEIDSERRFVIRWNDGILHGSIDRLVVAYHGEQAVSAEILDFKTDTIRPSEKISLDEQLAEKKAFYIPQLKAYRIAVSQLYRIPEDKITLTLLFTSPGRVMKF